MRQRKGKIVYRMHNKPNNNLHKTNVYKNNRPINTKFIVRNKTTIPTSSKTHVTRNNNTRVIYRHPPNYPNYPKYYNTTHIKNSQKVNINNNILISIILPVYNGINFIKESVLSVLRQTYTNFELIIVNDGSTDNTEKYIKSLKDTRIIYTKQKNLKLPTALNNGLNICKGKYITWTSHDNIYHKNALLEMKKALDLYPESDFVYAGHKYIGDKNTVIPAKFINPRQFLFRFRGCCCFMWRKKASDAIGLFDPNLYGMEDYDYLIRLLERNCNFVSINKILYDYRIHNKQLTSKIINNKGYIELGKKMAQKMLDRHGNNILNINLYYPTLYFCKDISRSRCIAYYDLAMNILSTNRPGLKPILSKNIDKYFLLSYNNDNSFTQALSNLVISSNDN